MGAVGFVFIMIVLLAGSSLCAIVSAVCLAIFSQKKYADMKYRKPLRVILTIVLVGSIIVAIIPIGFFSFIVYVNSAPPKDYVETAIVIEEDGYQDKRFTADGVVYEVLDLEANYEVCEELATPVFSYQTSGFLNGSQCGNYYEIENSHGFNLIWDGESLLFCPKDQKREVQSYYEKEDASGWFCYDYEEKQYQLTDDMKEVLEALSVYDIDNLAETELFLDELREIDIMQTSSDRIVLKDFYYLIIVDKDVYLLFETFFNEDEVFECKAVKLPEEIGNPLLQLKND